MTISIRDVRSVFFRDVIAILFMASIWSVFPASVDPPSSTLVVEKSAVNGGGENLAAIEPRLNALQ